MENLHIAPVRPGTPEIAICAKWRIEAFGDVLGSDLQNEIARLEAFVTDPAQQVALMASFDGVPAGTCLLTPKELEPCHPVSPWLAGLYVTPEFRRRGVGSLLIVAIEDQARQRGNSHVYLYADDAVAYYKKLGWRVVEWAQWHGYSMALMAREL